MSFFFSAYIITWHRSFLKITAIAYMNYIITVITIKKISITFLIASLEAPVGNMRRILCSDWLLDQVRWAHLDWSGFPCFDPAHRKRCVERTLKFRNFWTVLVMESQKRQKTVLFLFLMKGNFLIYGEFFLSSKLVKIAGYYPLFFLFTDLGFVFIHKNA